MVRKNITIEDAIITSRNFSGKEGRFNPAGKRNFCVILSPDFARTLEKEGWNVRWAKPKNPDEDERAYLQVSLTFDNFPPKIVLMSGKKKSIINEDQVSILDWAEFEKVDLTIRPYNWVMHRGTPREMKGVKAYLKDMYVTIVEDRLAQKYDMQETSATDFIGGCGHCEECTGDCD